jgi:hypothetical protein
MVVNSCLSSLPSTVLLGCPFPHSVGHICPVVGCCTTPLGVPLPIGILHQLLV